MPSELVINCSKKLADRNLNIVFAESATAGRLSSEFALTEDAGKILKGGLICYDAVIKEHLLGVSKSMIKKYTPESAEVTAAVALGLQKLIPADLHVAITGLTAPGGSETPEKPVGTMFISGIWGDFAFSERVQLQGDKETIILDAIDRVAEVIMTQLKLK